MGKKSRLKRERQGLPQPPRAPRRNPPSASELDWQASELERLLGDYLKAREALNAGAGPVYFRGQPVDYETLAKRFFEAGESQGLDRTGLMIALTVAMN